MLLFTSFQKQILLNYVIGSLIAVFGVGSIFIFHTLHLSRYESMLLLLVMLFSFTMMCGGEFVVYRRHVRPIREALLSPHSSFAQLEHAYATAHTFPVLTVKRIMGPHLLGLAVPASVLTSILIYTEYLHIPYHYIGFAWGGGFLVAVMHALIEFFLTYRSIRPLLTHFTEEAGKLYGRPIILSEKEFVSIKKKLFINSTFIAVFPVLLFTLASEVQLNRNAANGAEEYWEWAAVILVVILSLSSFCSLLVYEHIQRPMELLKTSITRVRDGDLRPIVNTYSDEFSHVVTGFNHMIQGIQERDARNEALIESFFTVFAATLDARDPYTAGHSIRVSDYAIRIAEEDGMPPLQIDLLRKSALLHDIGKIGIRDDVLLKDGRLTDEEFEQIKLHPVIGARILEQVNLPDELKPLLPGVKYHHERFDGRGYPEGLSGENIPLFGRIMAVADAYDAMTSDRPYRKGMPQEKALRIIEEGKGTQWDPHYAELFVRMMKKEARPNVSAV